MLIKVYLYTYKSNNLNPNLNEHLLTPLKTNWENNNLITFGGNYKTCRRRIILYKFQRRYAIIKGELAALGRCSECLRARYLAQGPLGTALKMYQHLSCYPVFGQKPELELENLHLPVKLRHLGLLHPIKC